MEKIVVDKSAFSESCQKHDFGSKNYKKAHFNRPKMKRKKKKKSYFGVCGGSSKPNLCKLKDVKMWWGEGGDQWALD